jgi:hypothetical protein
MFYYSVLTLGSYIFERDASPADWLEYAEDFAIQQN